MNARRPRPVALYACLLGCWLLAGCGRWMEGDPPNDPAHRDEGRYLNDVVYQQRHPPR